MSYICSYSTKNTYTDLEIIIQLKVDPIASLKIWLHVHSDRAGSRQMLSSLPIVLQDDASHAQIAN